MSLKLPCVRVLVVVVLTAGAVVAQTPVSAAPLLPATADPPERPGKIRFSFKGATFEQVIDFFARATELPVVWETPPP